MIRTTIAVLVMLSWVSPTWAQSVAITKATGVANTIQANGTFQSSNVVNIYLEVWVIKKGWCKPKWVAFPVDNFAVDPKTGKGTWTIAKGMFTKGTYQIRGRLDFVKCGKNTTTRSAVQKVSVTGGGACCPPACPTGCPPPCCCLPPCCPPAGCETVFIEPPPACEPSSSDCLDREANVD